MASVLVQEPVDSTLRFEPIETPVRSARETREAAVQKIFSQKTLLIRAVEAETTDSPIERSSGLFPNTGSVSREIDLMRSTGLKNASSTLIVPRQRILPYKPYGFLLNGHTSKLVHVAISDIGSCTDGEDRLVAPESMNLKTLQALSRFIETTPVSERPDMNEVNANFDSRDLLGLFVSDTPSMKMDILILQSTINKNYGMNLPIYIYDPELGELIKYQPNQSQIRRLLIQCRKRLGIPLCQTIAKMFDMTMTDRGRIISS